MAPKLTLILSIACAISRPIAAVETRDVEFKGKRHTVCTVDLSKEKLHLFLGDGRGGFFNNFENINRWLAPRKQKLMFAMNAGMFHPGFQPVGLYVDHGKTVRPLNLENAEGNFFLKPNGVFAVIDGKGVVVEATRYPAAAATAGLEKVQLATQSGPMLVIDGQLHQAFRATSDSRLFRNGVGILPDQSVVFTISQEPVNFHEFATLFRDELRCVNALFLDGTISSLYLDSSPRTVLKFPLGPIIGTIAPMD